MFKKLSFNRSDQRRDGCCCCITLPQEYSPNNCGEKNYLQVFFEKIFGKWILKLPIKVIKHTQNKTISNKCSFLQVLSLLKYINYWNEPLLHFIEHHFPNRLTILNVDQSKSMHVLYSASPLLVRKMFNIKISVWVISTFL